MKIGIIGGGASGLMTACLSKTNNNEVVILERNNECGKKILATGNGKCNYWNKDQNLSHYESSEDKLIERIINKKSEREVLKFFDNLGLLSKEKNGYLYPFSNQASTVKYLLLDRCKELGIEVVTNYKVEKLEYKDNRFIINNCLLFDKIVISTGSFASPKTGSDGYGFKLLENFNVKIRKPLPALTQLITHKGEYLNMWKGVRTDVEVTLFEDKKLIRKESGEIQLTDYGISGICVFNLSNRAARGIDEGKKMSCLIDFLPTLSKEELESRLSINKPIKKILEGLLNKKLVEVILTVNHIRDNALFNESKNKKELLNNIKYTAVNIKSVKGFDDAQVSSGGVLLSSVTEKLELKHQKGLYVAGELLDLTGDCGGYNLGIAWRCATIIGEALRGE